MESFLNHLESGSHIAEVCNLVSWCVRCVFFCFLSGFSRLLTPDIGHSTIGHLTLLDTDSDELFLRVVRCVAIV